MSAILSDVPPVTTKRDDVAGQLIELASLRLDSLGVTDRQTVGQQRFTRVPRFRPAPLLRTRGSPWAG